MAAIDSTKKSARFLQSRRYTHDTYTDAQEAFTSVLDINADEIYIDQDLIPSSGLPYNSSGDNGLIYSNNGQEVMKYYYRYRMTKSDLNNEVWFFTNPTGSTSGIGAQLIDSGQQTNFISPKYSVPSLANANTEDATPGYGVKVLIDGTQQSVNNYAFDYKTGVLQFSTSAVAPTAGQVVTISVYQYVGRTLSSQVGGGGSTVYDIFKPTGSFFATTNDLQVTGSLKITSGSAVFGSNLTANNSDLYLTSGSGLYIKDNALVDITGSLNMSGSVVIKGDLTVEGKTTLIQKLDPNIESLVVSGAMSIVQNQINSQVVAASLTIQNLGTWADRSNNSVIDCGDGFF